LSLLLAAGANAWVFRRTGSARAAAVLSLCSGPVSSSAARSWPTS